MGVRLVEGGKTAELKNNSAHPLPCAGMGGRGLEWCKVFDIDKVEVELACPICGFYATVTMGQIRLEDVVICGGCKANIQLVDMAGETGKCRTLLRRMVEDLGKKPINLTLRF
jgi:hypothetical protein